MKNSERGFAVVYGLVVLLLASVVGTSLLFMMQKDRSGATDYAKMRAVSQVAIAGLKACEGQFLTDPIEALNILRTYTSSNKPWMLSTAANSGSEQKIALGSGADAPRYSARVIRYDSLQSLVMIQSTGYLNNGSKKKAIATYQLSGLGLSNRQINTPIGFFIGGSLENLNSTMTIKGDTYLSMAGSTVDQHLNSTGIKTFEGNLKTGATTNRLSVDCSTHVTGKAFIRCVMWPQGHFKVMGDAGFTGSFYNWGSKIIYIDGNAYFTPTSGYGNDNCVDGKSTATTTAYFSTSTFGLGNKFKDFSTEANLSPSTDTYVGTQLGMNTTEASFTAAIPPAGGWPSNVTWDSVSGTITAQNVNDWWITKQGNGGLFLGEWLVLYSKGDIYPDGGTFTKKAIWIINHRITANIPGDAWFSGTDESNSIIYITGTNGIVSNFGVVSGTNFRGLIYNNSTKNENQQYQMGSSSSSSMIYFYGAIHQTTGKFNLNSGGPWTLDFSPGSLGESALQEIVNTGLFIGPGLGSTPASRTLTLVDTKLRPTQLSLQM